MFLSGELRGGRAPGPRTTKKPAPGLVRTGFLGLNFEAFLTGNPAGFKSVRYRARDSRGAAGFVGGS